MRSIRIYTSQSLTVGERVSLDDAAQRHVVHVLRMRVGDELTLFNGNGEEYLARISAAEKRLLAVDVLSRAKVDRESPLMISLYLALLKGEAMDWAIQKAVELGVARIVLMNSARSERQFSTERLPKRMAHWQKIIIAAAQQCGRTRLPKLCAPMAFADALQDHEGCKIILSPHDDLTDNLSHLAHNDIALMVGAEGGFSEEEVQQAHNAGWQAYRLGPRILRADTAVVSGLVWLQQRWGDL